MHGQPTVSTMEVLMYNRRQFLVTVVKAATGATVTLLLTPVVGACGSSSSTTTPAPAPVPATTSNPTTPACAGDAATTTSVLGHDHTVCVATTDLDNPPAEGMTYTTGPATGPGATDTHTHEITLSQVQLMAIAANQFVTVTTTVTESHTHDVTIPQPA
jgi:hypothetical protein